MSRIQRFLAEYINADDKATLPSVSCLHETRSQYQYYAKMREAIANRVSQLTPHPIPNTPSTELIRELLSLRIQMAALQGEVAQLRCKLEKSESTNPTQSIQAEPRLADVLAVTQEMFQGEPTVQLMHDPEDPDNPFVAVTVTARGVSAAELVKKRLEWHDRIARLSPGSSGALRLSVIPA